MSEYADVKLVLTKKAFRVNEDGTLRPGLLIPGLKDPNPGDIFSLSAAELQATGLRLGHWVRSGAVAVYTAPPKRTKRAKSED